MAHTHAILIRPIITEKSMQLAQTGWYTFAVAVHARKERIAKEVSTQYSVQVVDVRTLLMPGKTRSVGKTRKKITRSDWKKAIVRLNKGQHIPAFEITETKSSTNT